MPRNTGARSIYFVESSLGNSFLTYIYQSNIPDAEANDLLATKQETEFTAMQSAVYKPNNFKPAKAQKFINTTKGYVGSFCSDAAIPSLKDDGWQVTPKKFKYPALQGIAKAKLYYATVNSVKIGYRVNTTTTVPALIGLTLATDNDLDDIIMGASFPRLGFAKSPTGEKWAVDPAKWDDVLGTEGWIPVTAPKHTLNDLNRMLNLR